ncbi:hypothetical protein RB594_002517 [Gaeumannomyces avenae]
MASPSSPLAMSDADAPSSPVRPDKSFATNDDDDTRMPDATPEPVEKSHRGKGGRGANASQTPQQQPVIGKIRHLKKNDGEPLWREDIQYDFLKAVFDDEQKVFTNSFEPERLGKQNFADLYIDTMSRSSKTSKVLRDKLLSDRDAAKGMAMVCLLVNIGRMNTTLNFFPEMRAQLRTYHAIPSLQANQDNNAYKQLQDAPRLKSILKGGAEDRPEPNTLDKIKAQDLPRTNPVNLLFVIIQNATKIAELHFPANHEFHDLVMKTQYTSASRARAFLWIIWFYLESDFTEEGCEENPFGPGVDYGLDVANQGVPQLKLIKPGDPPENIDTPEEKEFGEEKKKMRAKIIDADKAFINDSQSKRGARPRTSFLANGVDDVLAAGSPSVLPRMRPSRNESDLDSTRSTPPRSVQRQLAGPVSGARRPVALKYQLYEGASSPAPGGPGGSSAPTIEGVVAARKPRPPTAHQIAVENNRAQRVNHIIDRGVRKAHHYARKQRRADGAIFRAVRRLRAATDDEHPMIPDPVDDSEGEETIMENQRIMRAGVNQPDPALHCGTYHGKKTPYRSRGFGGLCLLLREEDDDFGEEVAAYAAAFRRATRRLERWHESGPNSVIRPIKRPRVVLPDDEGGLNGRDPNETEDEMDQTMDQTMDLTMDQTALGGDVSMADTIGYEDDFTIDANSVLTPRGQMRRKRGTGNRVAALNGSSRRRTTGSPAASKRGKPAVNGTSNKLNTKRTADAEDGDELEDVDKLLLGIASGSDAEAGDGEAGDGDATDKDNAKDSDDEGGDLNDLDKTLLGIGDEVSDSD